MLPCHKEKKRHTTVSKFVLNSFTFHELPSDILSRLTERISEYSTENEETASGQIHRTSDNKT
jgi:hypothetical protein